MPGEATCPCAAAAITSKPTTKPARFILIPIGRKEYHRHSHRLQVTRGSNCPALRTCVYRLSVISTAARSQPVSAAVHELTFRVKVNRGASFFKIPLKPLAHLPMNDTGGVHSDRPIHNMGGKNDADWRNFIFKLDHARLQPSISHATCCRHNQRVAKHSSKRDIEHRAVQRSTTGCASPNQQRLCPSCAWRRWSSRGCCRSVNRRQRQYDRATDRHLLNHRGWTAVRRHRGGEQWGVHGFGAERAGATATGVNEMAAENSLGTVINELV